ncbi:hypothetical protein POM88_006249 [Heracleum sosnowskyi]|uniref:Uncharacterized protein n=1 Tax=Heracleum sosnowskyi TaxID=360622 RepID=A0AAD8J543_9APIA|nr:hypothetical protein POM88_006249 [Heracleum sosnowskyi]
MKIQSPSNLFVTITILTFGSASITCVSSAGYTVHVINDLDGNEPMGVTCGDCTDHLLYNPSGPPQVTLQHGERHLWHLDKLPAKKFACNLKKNGFETRIRALAMDSSKDPDRYFLAKSEAVYQDSKDLPFDDPRWAPDGEYDQNGKVLEKGWTAYNWLHPGNWDNKKY